MEGPDEIWHMHGTYRCSLESLVSNRSFEPTAFIEKSTGRFLREKQFPQVTPWAPQKQRGALHCSEAGTLHRRQTEPRVRKSSPGAGTEHSTGAQGADKSPQVKDLSPWPLMPLRPPELNQGPSPDKGGGISQRQQPAMACRGADNTR